MDILDMVKRIDKRYRITFFSSLIVGILSQGMGLFNKFSIRDDVCSLFKIGYTVTSQFLDANPFSTSGSSEAAFPVPATRLTIMSTFFIQRFLYIGIIAESADHALIQTVDFV